MISAYTTSRNIVSMSYPFRESLDSMLSFADEVVVFDTSDETDTTLTLLREMALSRPKLKIYHASWDWTVPNFGVLDGLAKARARSLCTGDFLFQADLDELIHEDQSSLIEPLTRSTDWNKGEILNLPVIEFWGSSGKVRLDVNLWKWRLSVNNPDITHGIPQHLRKHEDGLLYANHGTDGCDYVSIRTGNPVRSQNVVPQFMNEARFYLSKNNHKTGLEMIKTQVDQLTKEFPTVFHYSWWDIENKIRQYHKFWTGFWPSLYNETREERSNPFFPGLVWAEVSEQMIKTRAKELEEGCAGWIFHQPWDGTVTFGTTTNLDHPLVIKDRLGIN